MHVGRQQGMHKANQQDANMKEQRSKSCERPRDWSDATSADQHKGQCWFIFFAMNQLTSDLWDNFVVWIGDLRTRNIGKRKVPGQFLTIFGMFRIVFELKSVPPGVYCQHQTDWISDHSQDS